MKKSIIIVGGVAAYALYETGFLEALLNPSPDDDYDTTDDYYNNDLDINNPLALFAISLATQLGLNKISKAASKAVKARQPPAKSNIPVKSNPNVKPTAPKTSAPSAPKPTPAAAAANATTKPPTSGAAATKPVSKPNAATNLVSNATPPVKPPSAPATGAPKPPIKPPPPPVAPAAAAAKSAAKASKGASMISKLKGTPADLIVMVLAQILNAILDLDPDAFKPCDNGEFDLGKLPDWANAMIGAVPFLGDLFDLLGNKLCLKAGCPKDTEESAGLCYPPCREGFKSDGAVMCYKQYPDFENNSMGHTITSITKKILMDTGRVPNMCEDNEDRSGALCYEKVDGYTNVAGTVWQNCPAGYTDTGVRCEKLHTLPAGTLPRLSDCPAGWTNDGLTCREPISMSSCGAGWHDDGLTCRLPLGWDGCCHRGLLNECYGCVRGGNVEHKKLSGGRVEGRHMKGPDADEDRIDGLDYKKCPDGMSHQPGMPYLCSSSFTKQSRVLPPRGSKCPKKADGTRETEIGGLCYSEIPKGYSRKALGTLDQDCPAGSTDFGVGCTRESYGRGAGLIPLGIRVKDRSR